ncbi:hypothetical protein Sme01_10260 [Sphaerisporangium melleum]|uniref:WD40 repeat domain-containing protein n=1 Tax=Sphaerisporangium melleum TaxID=321316 RepID=A0A917QST9_9ACTN|nr:hypothetical protein [Sphaerisporangium melleum]GGK66840.1 hypothetical protein GCM10007964_07350 [Sphaerisporangium melleum]GII68550.1 hypothetical protein Sme01_10260 [Sphaerisporangium melleum]
MLTQACGHPAHAATSRVCPHLVAVPENRDVAYARLLTGRGMEFDLICRDCDEAERPAALVEVCEGCVDRLIDAEEMLGWRGQPEILERPEPLDVTVSRWTPPPSLGEVIDLAPVHDAGRSRWLALCADGKIAELDPDAGRVTVLATVEPPAEPDHKPWSDHPLRHRLHASACGRFAAVVNDYGRYGKVVDLARGVVTLHLDGGDYYASTVPFSLAFAVAGDRPVVVHRTRWNRLDVSDPATGEPLTAREHDETPENERPPHHLDYFHGRLLCSPAGRTLADDGWIWSPVGTLAVWSLGAWLDGNVWESEDGPSRHVLCHRDYYWDGPMCFVDDDLLAVGGIGDDEDAMLDGVRLFDTASGAEVTTFTGPADAFFSDGRRLYSAHSDGLHVWDPFTGHRTGTVPGFVPTCLHRGTGELAAITDNTLHRWRVDRSV